MYFFLVAYVQNDRQTERLSGPMVISTVNCPLTGRYFEAYKSRDQHLFPPNSI